MGEGAGGGVRACVRTFVRAIYSLLLAHARPRRISCVCAGVRGRGGAGARVATMLRLPACLPACLPLIA